NRELAALKLQGIQKPPSKGTTSIYFNSGSATASVAQQSKLASLRSAIEGNNNIVIELKAFTDATGNIKVNETLSKKRAAYVKNYLIKHYKLPDENITVNINPSSNAAGGISNPLDRRVDVLVTTEEL
ncbi:MAG: OmpA family protein, partial [Chitinophagaceae bacterium]